MLYNTKLNLLEPTKMLERVPVDNLRFINPLGHDYIAGAYTLPTPEVNAAGGSPILPPQMPTIAYKNIVAYNNVQIFGYSIYQQDGTGKITSLQTHVTVTANGNQIYTGEVSLSQENGYVMTTLNVASGDNITIVYSAYYNNETGGTSPCNATITISAVQNIVPKQPYTITQVVNRILNAGLGRLNGYYTLDPAIASAWENIPAPEFEITGKTLYEALLIVGGYKNIQAIPRLGPTPGSANDWEYNFITFDSLNGAEVWTPPVPKLDYHYEQDVGSYCGGIESYVDNFVDNTGNGTVGLPFPTTVRTESTELIIDDNYAIIPTKFPIYKVNTLTQAYINSSGSQVGDITPFVFEYSEYSKLTSYIGQFPTAKQFAFYYIQGQPNIYGLCLKPETATILDLVAQDMAAVQIAENKSGQSYNSTNGIAAFAYTINYTPMSSRRLRQYRPYQGAYPNNNILYYNQSANIIDSRNYGGRMKAELARIGNPTEIETYRLSALSQIPKAGMIKDGKYISQVNWEIGVDYIKVSLWLVKNYNRLSEYIGINSMQRFYEVSEKQATQRTVNYSYFFTIGDVDTSGSSYLKLPYETALLAFLNGTATGENTKKISFALVQPLAEDGSDIQSQFALEVIGSGFGNSVALYFAFADNYSAGNQALYNASARKLQKAVPYGDEYGQLYNLDVTFMSISTPKTLTYSDQVSTSTQTAFCDQLPSVENYSFNRGLYGIMSFETPTIDKNGGESLAVETQIHFQSNRSNVVIGAALAQYNPLVASEIPEISYVALPYIIQPLQEVIPTADITTYKVDTPTCLYNLNYIYVPGVTNSTSQTAQSWACVTADGEVIFAVNGEIAQGSTGQAVYFNTNLK